MRRRAPRPSAPLLAPAIAGALALALALAALGPGAGRVARGDGDPPPGGERPGPPAVVVIVHPANPAQDLDVAAIARIARADVRTWPHGPKVAIILPPVGSAARRILLERLYVMTERELKRHFVEKLYGGEVSEYPATAHTEAGVVRSVARIESAIGFVLDGEAAAAGAGVKVLRIGGKRPEDPGYPLRGE